MLSFSSSTALRFRPEEYQKQLAAALEHCATACEAADGIWSCCAQRGGAGLSCETLLCAAVGSYSVDRVRQVLEREEEMECRSTDITAVIACAETELAESKQIADFCAERGIDTSANRAEEALSWLKLAETGQAVGMQEADSSTPEPPEAAKSTQYTKPLNLP